LHVFLGLGGGAVTDLLQPGHRPDVHRGWPVVDVERAADRKLADLPVETLDERDRAEVLLLLQLQYTDASADRIPEPLLRFAAARGSNVTGELLEVGHHRAPVSRLLG